MTELWLRALARKFLSARQLHMMSRPAQRRGFRPRLEALEDRTLTSTLHIEAPVLRAAAPGAPLAAVSGGEFLLRQALLARHGACYRARARPRLSSRPSAF